MRWLGFMVLTVGCAPRIEENDEAGEGTGSVPSTGADASSGEAESSSGSESGLEGCSPPDPTATMELVVEFPGGEIEGEGGTVERTAACIVSGGAGGPGHSEIALECDELGGEEGVMYRIEIESPEDPIGSWLDWNAQVFLEFRHWYHWESGGGQSLRLAQGGNTRLVAYDSRMGGGFANTCEDGRADAEAWLASFPAFLESDGCGDASMLSMLVPTTNELAHPGTYGTFGTGASYVYEAGQCAFESDWVFRALLWW